MAKLIHMSQARFSKYFTDIARFSATKFVLYYRIQAAQQLLANSISITDCAEKLGYKSVATFTRAFQRVTQIIRANIEESKILKISTLLSFIHIKH